MRRPSTPWLATRTDPEACTAARSSGAAPPSGALDAALVLRSLIGDGEETWLRAGAGVTARSSPDRGIEETCEKLRSGAPHLRFSTD
ncbi:chorismate-binding protein [Streptomyces griseoincarnatus]|uniref:Chorismate-binding protein n=1 Tax=Streptomyces griseoincarnatus TaxID=29305 RepID=A0ABT0VW85_STRGI|nr:chorismate-binding protein [Streptomyces griseoincarnatus]